MITVGLPNYASDIAWLAMESLCRQQTTEPWELIVHEDSDLPMGQTFYNNYADRLKNVGCQCVKYYYSPERIPLNKKWIKINAVANPFSLGIILQASDCYSEPKRIQTAVDAMKAGYDWIHSPMGCFCNLINYETMLFKDTSGTGLNMAISKRAMNQIPDNEDKWSSVDYWLFNHLPENKRIFVDNSDNWKKGVDTDGFNRLSVNRKDQYTNPHPPFYMTDLKIENLIPAEVIKKF